MHKPYFPAQSSILCSQALLERVVSRYPLESPLECHLFNTHLNHVYLVRSGTSTYYLRIPLYDWRTRQDIEEEIHLLNYLQDNGVSTARPVKDKDGHCIQPLHAPEGIRFAVLFTNAGGKPCDISDKKQNYRFGEIIGRIHRLTDKMNKKYNKFHLDLDYLLEKPVERMCRFLPHKKYLTYYLKEIKENLEREVERLPKTTPGYGICHGDLHMRNIHFDRHLNPTIFDFDCFGYGWRGYEIGSYLYNLIHTPKAAANRVNWRKAFDEFLTGYDGENVLTHEEFNTIKIFAVIRHIWAIGLNFLLHKHNGIKVIMEGKFVDENIGKIKNYTKEIDFFRRL
ncbi:MAG: phosphotransferase [Candidatus Aminicenantes bacterium]|nr:phosphotransferase [Candidatus Aminicenantes bacterium]NIM79484.1 phosphotransferase [Candidatus Aminicenantes bacterium]NIN18770.1 phosphotransferase [Candidatus Aminicenantes bacterium]NIN42692.1 phosphotransferase [Candidatus Aminicenantes bacterium]NIN85426.1 phosphotransferase [Candidatus Aminicenantes bacterium]